MKDIRQSGLTLLELMTTVAVIGILTALALPAISRGRASSRNAIALNQLRQFTLGATMYADSANDVLVSNLGGPNVDEGETWVQGWMGPGRSDNTNTFFLQRSLLAPYLTLGLWQCPSAKSGTSPTPARTVSLNHFMGAPWPSEGYTVFRRLSDIQAPAALFFFSEESQKTLNDATFSIALQFDNDNPRTWTFADAPASHHGGAGGIGFADGHAILKKWQRKEGQFSGSNEDAYWLIERSTTWQSAE